MKHTHQTTQKGFTLIETLTAIFLLLITVTGPLTAAQGGLRASFFARDQVVAFYLAQDAIETIKNNRDNLALANSKISSPPTWLSNLGSCQPSTNGVAKKCTIDTSGSNISFATCPTVGSCLSLKINSSGEYTYGTGDETKYTRTVYVTQIKSNAEAQIIVEVTWDSNYFGERRVVVQENIYNWPPFLLNQNII